MTVLAVVFGNAIYQFLPHGFTHMFASFLFLVFGVKLLYEGYFMDGGEASFVFGFGSRNVALFGVFLF